MEKRDQKLNHLNNLVHLAKIDDHFDASEEDLIYRIGERSGFSREEIKGIINDPHTMEISHPDNEEEQFEYLFNVVSMMMVDGRLYQKELDYCTQVALQLGFKKIIVTVLIRAIEDGLKLGLTAEAIKKEAFELISE